jgi:hypothetical protein
VRLINFTFTNFTFLTPACFNTETSWHASLSTLENHIKVATWKNCEFQMRMFLSSSEHKKWHPPICSRDRELQICVNEYMSMSTVYKGLRARLLRREAEALTNVWPLVAAAPVHNISVSCHDHIRRYCSASTQTYSWIIKVDKIYSSSLRWRAVNSI